MPIISRCCLPRCQRLAQRTYLHTAARESEEVQNGTVTIHPFRHSIMLGTVHASWSTRIDERFITQLRPPQTLHRHLHTPLLKTFLYNLLYKLLKGLMVCERSL
jgi:hypothetical protein